MSADRGPPKTWSRREFFRGPLQRLLQQHLERQPGITAVSPSLADPHASPQSEAPASASSLAASRARRRRFPVHRPPGAAPEPRFTELCTSCTDCIEACPHDAILRAPARLREVAGTPMLQAASAPCRLCADTPCIEACETGALATEHGVHMGTAQIQEWQCLAHQGTFCSVCHEQCPVPGAIKLDRGRPSIEASSCVGCGVCHFVCPAPQNAILLLPGTPQS